MRRIHYAETFQYMVTAGMKIRVCICDPVWVLTFVNRKAQGCAFNHDTAKPQVPSAQAERLASTRCYISWIMRVQAESRVLQSEKETQCGFAEFHPLTTCDQWHWRRYQNHHYFPKSSKCCTVHAKRTDIRWDRRKVSKVRC